MFSSPPDTMPRSSVARVYANVNAERGPAWYEYGQYSVTFKLTRSFLLPTIQCTDNLQVQWGMQDHYEIVKKVGRGKYSEVRTPFFLLAFDLISGLVRCLRAYTLSMTRNASSRS